MHTHTSGKDHNNYHIVAYQLGARLFVAQVAADFERRKCQFIGRFNVAATKSRELIWTEDIASGGFATRSGIVVF